MNILFVSSISIPSYFNAGHHIRMYECAQYVRQNFPDCKIDCLDASSLNVTWMDFGRKVYKPYDIICIYCDYDTSDNLYRQLLYIRELNKKSKILFFGRLVSVIPAYFEKFTPDAMIVSGDYEAGIEDYILYLYHRSNSCKGLRFLDKQKKYIQGCEGAYLSVDKIVFPDIHEIPFERYYELYRTDANRFCGIPNKKELVVPLTRGCPIGCSYCEIHIQQGNKERRRSVEDTIKYIEESFRLFDFDYVTFYSANFTYDKIWVREFCEKIRGKNITWKCTTSVKFLTKDLFELLSNSGCFRLSIGLEIVAFDSLKDIPRCKHQYPEDILMLQEECLNHNIELNCFVMLGLPNVTYEHTIQTLEFLEHHKIRYRPTIHTPYFDIPENVDDKKLQCFNRQLFIGITYTEQEKLNLYKYIYGREE